MGILYIIYNYKFYTICIITIISNKSIYYLCTAVPPWQNPETKTSCQNFTALLGISPCPAVATMASTLDSWTHGTCGKKHLKHGGFVGFIWFIYDVYDLYMIYMVYIYDLYVIFIGWTSMKCGNTCGKNTSEKKLVIFAWNSDVGKHGDVEVQLKVVVAVVVIVVVVDVVVVIIVVVAVYYLEVIRDNKFCGHFKLFGLDFWWKSPKTSANWAHHLERFQPSPFIIQPPWEPYSYISYISTDPIWRFPFCHGGTPSYPFFGRDFPFILSKLGVASFIWVNYNSSLTWIKAIWGWFPLLTMISSEVAVRSWSNLPRFMEPPMYFTRVDLGMFMKGSPRSPLPDLRLACRWETNTSLSCLQKMMLSWVDVRYGKW